MTRRLLEALAVTCELTGTQPSPGAARIMAADLARYPEEQVIGALERCRRELRGALTLSAVIDRLEDGRPGPDEAWSIMSQALGDEAVTVVATGEMMLASGVCRTMGDDPVAARMAFLETYRRLVRQAREGGAPAQWTASLGWDARGREAPIREAIAQGRLTSKRAAVLIPDLRGPAPEIARRIVGQKLLRGPEADGTST